jgi:phosphoribosylformimino-5-aminoimidazole carboxamide ribotide isomerase
MRIIGVIDLRAGRAVHARGGRRDAYAPVRTAAGVGVNGDAIALGRVYVNALGVGELYVADLDAIERGVGAMQTGVIGGLAALGVPVWVDAGISSAADAATVLAAGASTAIVGLETLTTFEALGVTCTAAGGERIAFSVDLRNGVPVVSPNGPAGLSRASDIAARAAAAGVGAVVVLDLARVGTGAGIDVQLMEDVRKAAPRVVLLAGGGVRDSADLDALAAAGCDGALVATALLSGAIDASGRDKALSRDDRDSSRPLRGHPRSE